jgi:uncharacterized protein YcaQ
MSKNRDQLTLEEARRLAIAAQGLSNDLPPDRKKTGLELPKIAQIGLIQIDSVNVLIRSHYLPLFSRLGPYRQDALDELAYAGKKRRLFEYWGHEASLIPVERQPLFRWRMARAAAGDGLWEGNARFARERPEFISRALEQIVDRGSLAASQLSDGGRASGSWWGWSDGKRALEHLFWTGRITTASRRNSFERVYDLTERVLPSRILNIPTPSEEDAQRELIRIAARAMGVATERDLRDYFRLGVHDARARIAELVENGELKPVAVLGWKQQAYLHKRARKCEPSNAQALLSPFDSLIWERDRTERLFGVRVRLEIYTPAHKRVHGYYVLPFLLGDRIAARVDLKSDRKNSTLLVHAAHLEPHADEVLVAPALAEELRRMAGWLGFSAIRVTSRRPVALRLGKSL